MDKKTFWQSIERAKEEAGDDLDHLYKLLVDYLTELTVDEIMLWMQIFNEYQKLSYKEKLWAAAYVINGGCSDDGFDYFRAWLTAQGKDVFLEALEDPDSLADCDAAREDEACFEDIMSAPCVAYFRKLGMTERDYGAFYKEYEKYALPEALSAEMAAEIVYDKDIDENWDEDELEPLLPKLCKKFEWE